MNKYIGDMERPGDGAFPQVGGPEQDPPLRRLKKKEPRPFLTVGLVLLALFSGGLLILSLPPLVGADSLFDYIKCGVIGFAGGFVAYFVNRLAMDRGAVQAAIGSLISGAASILAMLVVGVGMFSATFAGFTVEQTDQLRIAEYAEEKVAYLSETAEQARAAARIAPAVQSLLGELSQAVECERTSNCLSGGAATGQGPVFRVVAAELRRVEALADVVAEGERKLLGGLEALAGLRNELQGIVADETLGLSERRTRAADVVGRMGELAGVLSEASPIAAVQGYADTLSGGLSVPGRPDVEAQLNRLLAAHRTQLQAVLASIPEMQVAPPVFPAPTGVVHTLGFAGNFLSLALLLIGTELIAPLLLWLLTFVALRARVEEDDPEEPVNLPPMAPGRGRGDQRRARR